MNVSLGGVTLALFDGVAGQRISVLTDLSRISPCSTVSVLGPDALPLTPLTVPTSTCASNVFTGATVLTQTGTYSATIAPNGTGAGTWSASATFFNVPPDVTAPITPGGTLSQVNIGTPGQLGSFTFSGTAGEKVSLFLNFQAMNSTFNTYVVLNPDSTPLVPSTRTSANGFYIANAPIILAQTGTYTIKVTPDGAGTGTTTAAAYNVPADATAALTPGGSLAQITIGTPGQNGSFTFSGTAGQKVSVLLNFQGLNSVFNTYSVANPDGTFLVSGTRTSASSFYITNAPIVLPQTGTYTIAVDPDIGGTGIAKAALYNVPSDATATITAGGSLSQLTFTTPGQLGSFTFSGTAGQKVTLFVNFQGMSSTFNTYAVANPDGTFLVSSTRTSANGFYPTNAPIILPQTGTYTIAISPDIGGTGNTTSALFNVPADATATLTIGGPSASITTGTPGQHGSFTFAGSGGQSASLAVNFTAISGCSTLSVLKPDGTVLIAATHTCAGVYSSGVLSLSQTGTYSIAVIPDLGGATTSGTGTISASAT
jgi:hypothetical protein